MTPTAITEPVRLTAPADLLRWSNRCRTEALTIGLVPTMGALHGGHRGLIRRARVECERTVVSVFVNPRQFELASDLDAYPREVGRDLEFLSEEGVDAVYLPAEEAMYPRGHATEVRVTGSLTGAFEGAVRPAHFDGVALVVAKLLAAARPDRFYLGAKDAQQCAVIRRLVLDLDLGVELRICPTVRDADGLALSSRNQRLSSAERTRALAIPEALSAAAEAFATGVDDPSALGSVVNAHLQRPGLEADYVAVVDPETFGPVATAVGGSQVVIAARVGGTRLLDALTLGDPPPIRHHSGLCESPEVPVPTQPEVSSRCSA